MGERQMLLVIAANDALRLLFGFGQGGQNHAGKNADGARAGSGWGSTSLFVAFLNPGGAVARRIWGAPTSLSSRPVLSINGPRTGIVRSLKSTASAASHACAAVPGDD